MEYIYIIVNFIISIIVAVVTAKIAIKDFYRQEIWLRKESKYSEIIGNLSILQKYYGDMFDEFVGESESIVDDDLIKKKYNTSLRELELVTFSNGFMLNPKVSDILSQLFYSARNKTENERMGDFVSYIDRMYGEIRDSKEKIIEIAKKDLKVKN
ncbi:hypothetical protein CIW83_02715 [Tissierella sp. P1]|uniref:hypothetical protein n=1 Tax=Tissierella sp. P1 TaxID=1280483 RepID=UPI000BA00845|nr:hypothetical protein [Tissierella sp. P1]OZV13474.1 hypothetical protein CIW83_02715 [Tissierella sp. P1]